jgi:hypothetical protein
MAKKKKTTKKKTKANPSSDASVEEAVEKQLKKGPQSHKELREKLGRTKADPALGRTLQRLRRQGKLVVVKGRWTLAGGAKICTKCGGKGWVNG